MMTTVACNAHAPAAFVRRLRLFAGESAKGGRLEWEASRFSYREGQPGQVRFADAPKHAQIGL